MILQLKGLYRIYPFLLFATFLFLGVITTIKAFESGSVLMQGFMILWLILMLIYIYKFFFMAVRLEITSDGRLFFTIVTGKKYEFTAKEIISIVRKNNFVDIKTTRKKFITVSNFTRFRDFVMMIKSSNPDLIIKGY
jgi:Ca2+/Na+ antiporter